MAVSDIYDTWEELWARWAEEMRATDRDFLRLINEANPSFERIAFFATAPGADALAKASKNV